MLFLLALFHAAAAEPTAMTLEEALARVEADGPDLAVAQARAEAADGVVRQASAAMKPILAATGAYQQNDEEVVLSFSKLLSGLPGDPSAMPPDVTLQAKEAWTGSVSLRVPIVAGSAYADLAAAKRQSRAADAGAEAARVQVRSAVVQACAAADAAEGLVEAAERGVTLAEAHRDAVSRAVAAGTEGRLALLQAGSDVAARQSDLAQARADLARTREQLGALLGVDGPVDVELPALAEVPAGPEVTPSVEAAQWQLASAESRVASAWWRHAPTLSAYGVASASTVPYPTGKDTTWRAGVELQWVLYDGGLRYGRLDQAVAERHAAEAALRAEELRASREERDAERDLGVAKERLALAEAQLALASEAEQVARKGLAAGTVSALEARDAEQRAFQADVAHEAAAARVTIAAAGLARARGVAW